jgi:hypothetical protein
VSRHAAADGASAHPLVAAALAQRSADAAGAHRDGTHRDGAHRNGARQPAGEDGLGWPGPPPAGGGGLGWPADATDGTGSAPAEEPAPPAFRRGWRRFFGASRVA